MTYLSAIKSTYISKTEMSVRHVWRGDGGRGGEHEQEGGGNGEVVFLHIWRGGGGRGGGKDGEGLQEGGGQWGGGISHGMPGWTYFSPRARPGYLASTFIKCTLFEDFMGVCLQKVPYLMISRRWFGLCCLMTSGLSKDI